MKDHKNTAYTELIEAFITYKRIQGYKYVTEQDTLEMFENFLTQYPAEEICIKKDIMNKWCHPRPYESRKTLGNRISVVRQFAIYMVSKGYYSYIPSTLPHAGRSDFIPYIFSDDEMDRIFHVLDNLPPNRRYNSDTAYPVLFRVLYGCGLRIGETLSLRIVDVDTIKGILTIRHAKFDKSRLVPMTASLTAICHDYRCTYLLDANENSCFFQNKDGSARSRHSVAHFFREILWQSKIPYQCRDLTDVLPPAVLRPEPRTYTPYAFEEDELNRFFHVCDSIQPYLGRRASVIRKFTVPVFFRLLYSTGMRTTEARLLRTEDVDLRRGVIDIQKSKGYDQHYVVMHDTIANLMARYDRAIAELQPSRTYFFQSCKDSHYSREWVKDNFRTLWNKANGFAASPVAYDIRHHYAIVNINRWTDDGFGFSDKLHYLSKSMGHRSIEATRYYYSIVPRLADTLRDKTEDGFNAIVPEVSDDEEE